MTTVTNCWRLKKNIQISTAERVTVLTHRQQLYQKDHMHMPLPKLLALLLHVPKKKKKKNLKLKQIINFYLVHIHQCQHSKYITIPTVGMQIDQTAQLRIYTENCSFHYSWQGMQSCSFNHLVKKPTEFYSHLFIINQTSSVKSATWYRPSTVEHPSLKKCTAQGTSLKSHNQQKCQPKTAQNKQFQCSTHAVNRFLHWTSST